MLQQLQRVLESALWLIGVVIGHEIDLAAVDAAGRVDGEKAGHCATLQFAPEITRGTIEGCRHADQDFLGTNAGIVGPGWHDSQDR